MNIPPEYLKGLDDVANQIRSVVDGSYRTDAIIPEPSKALMSRLVEHVRLMVEMYPNDNLIGYADIANQGSAWIMENT